MSITQVFPSPKSVMVQGRIYRVAQLQIRDFAVFQTYLEESFPHPLVEAEAELMTLDDKGRRKRLTKLQLETKDYPPTYPDSEQSVLHYLDPQHYAFWLGVVLGKCNDLKDVNLVELAEAVAVDEYTAIERAAYNWSPKMTLHKLVFGDEDDHQGGEFDWAKTIDEVAREHGWTYDYIGELTLSQFAVAVSGHGRKPKVRDLSHLPMSEVIRIQREQKIALGEIEGDQ